MALKNYGVRIEPSLKEESEAILKDYGIGFAEGVRIFLTQMVNRGELPIELKRPNSTTLAAMKELEESTSSDVENVDAYLTTLKKKVDEGA